MNEEAVFKWGMDMTAVMRGLRSMKTAVNEFRNEVSHSFVDMGKEIAGALFVGGAIGTLEKLGEKVEQIKTKAEELETSTSFIQGIGFAFDQVGVGAEKGFKGMEKLAVAIGKARDAGKTDLFGVKLSEENGNLKDTETIFYQIADAIKGMPDPTERARAAVELFGKSGVEMLPALMQGGDELKKMADSAEKLSEVDIKTIEDAVKSVKELFNSVLVGVGKVVGAIAYAARFWGASHMTQGGHLYSDVDDIDAASSKREEINTKAQTGAKALAKHLKELNQLDEEGVKLKDAQLNLQYANANAAGLQEKAQKEFDAALKRWDDYKGDGLEKDKLLIEAVNKQVTLEKAKHTAEKEADDAKTKAMKEHADLMEGQARLAKQIREEQEKNMHAQEDLSRGFQDRGKVPLSDLEKDADDKLSRYGRRARLTDFEVTALDIRATENAMRQADKNGDTKWRDELNKRALDMRRSLGDVITDGDANPLRGLQESAEKTSDAVIALQELAEGDGLNINLKTQP